MKRLKQGSFTGLCLLAAMIIVVVGMIVYYEVRFTAYCHKEVSISQEKILEEMPEIAITEIDESLLKSLWQCEPVKQAMEDAEEAGTTFFPEENPNLQKVVAPFETDTLKVFEVHVQVYKEGIWILCNMRDGTERSISFYSDLNGSYEKAIYLYKGIGADRHVDTFYSNRDGELSKHVNQRMWFSWFPERLFS